MSVMVLQIFVSLMLVGGSLLLLAISVKQDDHEHADRLSLLPFQEDDNREEAPAQTDAAPDDLASQRRANAQRL